MMINISWKNILVLQAQKFGDLHALESSETEGPNGKWGPRLIGGVYATIVTDLASSSSGALAAAVCHSRLSATSQRAARSARPTLS